MIKYSDQLLVFIKNNNQTLCIQNYDVFDVFLISHLLERIFDSFVCRSLQDPRPPEYGEGPAGAKSRLQGRVERQDRRQGKISACGWKESLKLLLLSTSFC